jgi:hypothetical protein
MVVLPTPGPPVMTRTFDSKASRMADIGLSANDGPVLRDPWHRLFCVDGRPGQRSRDQAPQSLGNHLFSAIQAAQEDTGGDANRVGDHRPVGELELQRNRNQLLRHLQQPDRELHQFLGGGKSKWLSSIASVIARDTGADPDHRCRSQA